MNLSNSRKYGNVGQYVTKKSPGPLYGQGVTRGHILSIIFDNPDGIEEGEIREIMWREFHIRESKGIKKHLSGLSDQGLVQKLPPKPGKSNVWKPSGLSGEVFCKIWGEFPEEVRMPIFSSTFIQGFIQEVIVVDQIENFEYIGRSLDEGLQNLASKSGAQYTSIFDRGVDYRLFISRAFELSPSLTLDQCTQDDSAWSLYLLSAAILDYSLCCGADIVKEDFESPLGRDIYRMLITLLVDMVKYPGKTEPIAEFLCDPNTKGVLSLIFTRPEETVLKLARAQIDRDVNIWELMDGVPSSELDKFAVAKRLVDEYIDSKIRGVTPKHPEK